MQKRFSNELLTQHSYGFRIERRAAFAEQMLQHFGVVAGTLGKEDSQGRATIILQEPIDLVARAFAIADAFYDQVEERGDTQDCLSLEEAALQAGKLQHIRMEAEYAREKSSA